MTCNTLRNSALPTLLLFLGAGCALGPRQVETRPGNVFVSGNPVPIRRVAVMPLTKAAGLSTPESWIADLEPGVHASLAKQGRFELVGISRRQLLEWTGRETWAAEEILPTQLMSKIREETACDALLFSRVVHYHPYGPIQIGWHFKLVDSQAGGIVWAAEQLFNSSDPGTVQQRAAWKKWLEYQPPDNRAEWMVSHSPRYFGQMTAGLLLSTIPGPEAQVSPQKPDKLSMRKNADR